jgi:hypothetical protein
MSKSAFGGSIEQKKYKCQDGTTRVSYLARIDWPPGPDGERRRESKSFRRKDDAKAWLAEKVAQLGKGILVHSGKRTVGQFLDQWVKTLGNTSLSVGTRRRYTDLMRQHVIPSIGHRPLDKLTKADIEELYAGRLAAGMHPSILDLLHNRLHKALDYDVDLRHRTVSVRQSHSRGEKGIFVTDVASETVVCGLST